MSNPTPEQDNCSRHKRDIAGITDMKLLAEMIGDLHYESLADLLNHLSDKLYDDAQYTTTNDDRIYEHSHNCTISDLASKTIAEKASEDKLSAVYMAVVEFIQWYNKTKQP